MQAGKTCDRNVVTFDCFAELESNDGVVKEEKVNNLALRVT